MTQRARDPKGFARDVEDLRVALRDYLDFHSLRHASREIGMSPTGLSNFVNGDSTPHVPTLRKLMEWRAKNPTLGQG
jgi:hypothetical protein